MMKHAGFPALVFTLTSQTTPLNRRQWKVTLNLSSSKITRIFTFSGFRSLSDGLHHCGSQEQLNTLHQMVALSTKKKEAGFEAFRKAYKTYKENYARHLLFDPAASNLSIFPIRIICSISILAVVIERAPLEAVYIFFDTATYDQIERDIKVGNLY